MYNILISGDSWGVGEWGKNKNLYPPPNYYGILDYSYINYFRSKDNVIVNNFSEGNISNTQSINLIFENIKKDTSHIIWFQTDPFRNLRPYETNFDLKKIKNVSNLLTYQNELLNNSYKKLNSLNKTVYCIGGCSKLNLELIAENKNLIPLIPSITEFLLPNYIHPSIWLSDWINFLPNEKDIDIEILNFIAKNFKIQRSLEFGFSSKYFYPDGQHPNREGIKIICNYIWENVFQKKL